MLKEYKKKYTKALVQHLILDFNGNILESDDLLFSNTKSKNITAVHPFFETVLALLEIQNEEFTFSCIHLEIDNYIATVDITLKTFNNKKQPLLIIHDLTDHYNNYQATAQVRNESVINSQILELKNTYLKEKETFKNTFIANFSHELRDPLTGILTFSDILSKTELDHEQSDYLQILNSTSNFLKKMIDDILDISKIESGKLELTIEPFSIKELLNDIRYNYQVKAEQKGLEFNYYIDEKLPEVIGGDEKRLRQVISNLLDNAIKFTPSGSVTFNVSLNQIRAQKASIHFEVTDTGIGIKEEHFKDIFTSFVQVSENNAYKGTGLGLAIVKYLVELTGSKISVKSIFGEGSTFSTNINFVSNAMLRLPNKIEGTAVTFNPSKKYNILLVEDSEITQLSVLKILASKGQFFLDIVTKPQDALNRISTFDNEIDLVLMDIKLKDHNGEEIAKQIRKLPERQHRKVPIIAMTARVFKQDIKDYKKAGINDVIKKPFDENQLLKKMAEYLK